MTGWIIAAGLVLAVVGYVWLPPLWQLERARWRWITLSELGLWCGLRRRDLITVIGTATDSTAGVYRIWRIKGAQLLVRRVR